MHGHAVSDFKFNESDRHTCSSIPLSCSLQGQPSKTPAAESSCEQDDVHAVQGLPRFLFRALNFDIRKTQPFRVRFCVHTGGCHCCVYVYVCIRRYSLQDL